MRKHLLPILALTLPTLAWGQGVPEHLLDGVSFNFFYQTGAGISIQFDNGLVSYEWISGPAAGNTGRDIPYRSRKIGDDMYLINFHEEAKPDFVTLIFNLKQNVMYSSAILRYGTEGRRISFSGGIIEHVER